jgi:tetratricopeptide (TPR) repeat protein
MFMRNLHASLLALLLLSLAALAQQPPQPTSTTPADATKNTQAEKAAEKPAPTPAPTPRTMPNDQKAYMDAQRIKDPVKKMEALEKYLTDYPNSPMVSSAHLAILETLVKLTPRQPDKILWQVKRMVDRQGGFSTGFTESQIATQLLKAEMFEEAEQYAQKAAVATAEFMERQLKSLQQQKARPLSVLGQIYLKQGKLKEAEAKFKEAFAVHPQEAGVAVGLAEIAEKQGKDKDVVEYLLAAGRLKLEERKKLETFWSKTHGGSLKGLEEELDHRYHKEYGNLIPVARYQPTAVRSTRAVLAEVFTGAACGPCVAADLAFEAMMNRYSRKELVVLMYHMHIPGPDPMTNPATLARGRYYGVGGVPGYNIDGLGLRTGGGPKEATKDNYNRNNPVVEQRLEASAEAQIKLDATLESGIVKVAANVTVEPAALKQYTEAAKAAAAAAANPNVSAEPVFRLHVALAEDGLRYTGENGIRIHPVVVRALAGENATGLKLDPAAPATLAASFDLAAISTGLKTYLDEYEAKDGKLRSEDFAFTEKKHEINANNLSIVAFVQEEKSKKILQAIQVPLNGKGVAMK